MQGKPIIVALDYADAAGALAMASRLDPQLCRVKVGKELFTAAGPDVVRQLVGRGFDVFLDLKYHDIPNTVAGACRAAAKLGAWMLDVHASGGEAMMRAAREAVAGNARVPLVIGVTVLTSLGDNELAQIGFRSNAGETVLLLAKLAKTCGLDGVVCSAREAPRLRSALGPGFALVTPGIRLPGDDPGDQARTATPLEAISLGADYLVVGRPITSAADPVAALHRIRESIVPATTP